MSVKFEFVLSDEWLASAIAVRLKYRSRFHIEKPVKIVASFILAIMAIMLFFATPALGVKVFLTGAFFIALIFVMFNAHKVDYWLAKRRFKKSPFRNERCTVSLSEDGLLEITGKSEHKLKWSTFVKAFRADDDFMLLQYDKQIIWLPKKALIEGTVEEAESIIKSHVGNYEIKK